MMVTPGQRARTRLRNRRVALTVVGMLGLSALCVWSVAAGFSGGGAERTAHPKKKPAHAGAAVRRSTSTTRAPAPAPTTTAAPAPSTSTTPTTARTTTTIAHPTPTTAPAPTTLPAATAFASATNLPEFCTVTVNVSTGVSRTYPLAAYVENPGDLYTFTALVGGYQVQVTASVIAVNHVAECQPTLANLRPA